MPWVILVLSGALEAVWATALARSDGLKKWRPTAVFLLAMTASMVGLGWAMQLIPTGTAYAVWGGSVRRSPPCGRSSRGASAPRCCASCSSRGSWPASSG